MEELVLKNDFYEWAYSDFLVNNQRGHLAEYIIAKALNTVSQKRLEWDPFDIKYKNLKIEVKSCAYIQAWEQKDFSKISFDIAPTRLFDLETEHYCEECKRQSDLYIFCLLKHKDRETINPLLLKQWVFYIVPTSFLNLNFNKQKRISLSKLQKNNIPELSFTEIKKYIDNLKLN